MWICVRVRTFPVSASAVGFNESGSRNEIRSSVLDLLSAMQRATALESEGGLATWLDARGADPGAA